MKRIYANLAQTWATKGQSLLIGVTGLVLILLLAGTVLAQSSANYKLEWNLIGGGGQRVSSNRFVVDGTAGQPAAGPPFPSSDNFVVSGGYWPGASPPLFHKTYLPQVMRDF